MKKIAILAMCLVLCLGLSACGSSAPKGTFYKPTTVTSASTNGLAFAFDLAQLSENINYTASLTKAGVPTIDSLEKWVDASKGVDSADQPYTYKVTAFGNNGETPSFVAGVYDSGAGIMDVRVSWESARATSDPEMFERFSICMIMATTGVDENTAKQMYDTIQAAAYVNGSSETLTYACFGSVRCYYMVNNGYHLVVAEPFSAQSRADEEAAGCFIYIDMTTTGTLMDVEAQGTAAPASSGQGTAAPQDNVAVSGGNAAAGSGAAADPNAAAGATDPNAAAGTGAPADGAAAAGTGADANANAAASQGANANAAAGTGAAADPNAAAAAGTSTGGA